MFGPHGAVWGDEFTLPNPTPIHGQTDTHTYPSPHNHTGLHFNELASDWSLSDGWLERLLKGMKYLHTQAKTHTRTQNHASTANSAHMPCPRIQEKSLKALAGARNHRHQQCFPKRWAPLTDLMLNGPLSLSEQNRKKTGEPQSGDLLGLPEVRIRRLHN